MSVSWHRYIDIACSAYMYSLFVELVCPRGSPSPRKKVLTVENAQHSSKWLKVCQAWKDFSTTSYSSIASLMKLLEKYLSPICLSAGQEIRKPKVSFVSPVTSSSTTITTNAITATTTSTTATSTMATSAVVATPATHLRFVFLNSFMRSRIFSWGQIHNTGQCINKQYGNTLKFALQSTLTNISII